MYSIKSLKLKSQSLSVSEINNHQFCLAAGPVDVFEENSYSVSRVLLTVQKETSYQVNLSVDKSIHQKLCSRSLVIVATVSQVSAFVSNTVKSYVKS